MEPQCKISNLYAQIDTSSYQVSRSLIGPMVSKTRCRQLYALQKERRIIIRNGAKTISLQTFLGRLN